MVEGPVRPVESEVLTEHEEEDRTSEGQSIRNVLWVHRVWLKEPILVEEHVDDHWDHV